MITPNNRIRAALRQLWLRSRERAERLKMDDYSCVHCHVKQSKAQGKEQKVQVHHKEGVLNWEILQDEIRKYLLTNPEHLETLCPDCHKKETYGE